MKKRTSRLQDYSPSSLWRYVTSAWQLAKVPLCLLVCCSAGFGASLVPHVSGEAVLVVSSGVLLLAMGGATVNSLQETVVDTTMQRTSGRPLVCNRVSREFAIIQAIFLIACGIGLLAGCDDSPVSMLLGISAILIYNGVYTRLKQRTVLAILPGAVCGGLPPLIGWIGGGGQLFSYMPMLLFFLLFLWQVPHFCLILLRHSDDYLQAEQPTFMRLLSEKGVRQLSTVWICALALVMMLFAITSIPAWQWQKIMLVLNAMILACLAMYSLVLTVSVAYRTIFIALNILLFNHMAILIAGFLLS